MKSELKAEPSKDMKQPTMAELLEALSQEMNSLHKQINSLQYRISKYDRIFEKIFKEEAEQRLGLREGGTGTSESHMSPLEDLKWKLSR